MSDIFILLTRVVDDYPFVFSPSDISWVGGFLFLITAALSQIDKQTPEQQQSARKYRLSALITPAVCVAFNIAYIRIYPEILVNYLLYAVPIAILSYYSLWIFLSNNPKHEVGIQSVPRRYHLAVLVWIGTHLFYGLFSTLPATETEDGSKNKECKICGATDDIRCFGDIKVFGWYG